VLWSRDGCQVQDTYAWNFARTRLERLTRRQILEWTTQWETTWAGFTMLPRKTVCYDAQGEVQNRFEHAILAQFTDYSNPVTERNEILYADDGFHWQPAMLGWVAWDATVPLKDFVAWQ